MDLDTGKTIWNRDLWTEFEATKLERGVAATPMIESGQMIFTPGGIGSGLISLSADTGQTLWCNTDFKAAYTSPTIGDLGGQRQVVALMHEVLCGVDPETGKLLWQIPFPVDNTVHVASPLIIGQQYVLAGSSSGGTRLLRVFQDQDRWQVQEVWQTNRCTPQVGNFLLMNDKIIAPASGGSANFTVCLNLHDGSVAWKERFGGRGSLVLLRDGFATLNEQGVLSIRQLEPAGSREIFHFPNFGTAPQWSTLAWGEQVLAIQTGETLRIWRFGD